MEQGFLFNGIHILSDKPTIDQSFEPTILIVAHAADPPSSRFYDAQVAAQPAPDLVVIQLVVKQSIHKFYFGVKAGGRSAS